MENGDILELTLEIGIFSVLVGLGITMGMVGFLLLVHCSTGIRTALMCITLMVLGFTLANQSMNYLTHEEESPKDSTGIVISAEYVGVKDSKRNVEG